MAITPETVAELNERAQTIFRRAFAAEPAAAAYITARGLTPETIETWGIGYAPRGGRALLRELAEAGYDEGMIAEAGLARAGERGVSDLFRDRITLPIRDLDGTLIAFGSRVFREGDDGPKYLNSPETPLFKKSRTLFGIDQAIGAIRKSTEAIVVEGNLDAISLHQAGERRAIAAAGTALTLEHIGVLGELATTITLVIDADEAGRKATRRILLLPGIERYDLRVLRLPEGPNGEKVDPDALLRADPAAFERLLPTRISRWEYLYTDTLAPYAETLDTDVESRVAWKNEWGAVVAAHARDQGEASKLLARAAKRLGLTPALLTAEYAGSLPAAAGEAEAVIAELLRRDWTRVRHLVPALTLHPQVAGLVSGWGETAPNELPAAMVAALPRDEAFVTAGRARWNREIRPAARARLGALIREGETNVVVREALTALVGADAPVGGTPTATIVRKGEATS
jgi:DNA primase catalytic core